MNFRQKIAFEINNASLSREEVAHFKWRCAVRAFPFLGYKGNLKFWRGKVKKQKYLYKIFHGLDLAYYYKSYGGNGVIDEMVDIWINEACDELCEIYYDTDDLKISNLTDAISAAISSPKEEQVEYAVNVYSLIDTSLDLNHPLNKENELLPIIINDLESTKKGLSPTVDINFYGEVWQLFGQVLLDTDCAYWWFLYKSIFENNFAMDEDALKLRVKIKKRIHKKGAAAVGHYLEALGEN